MVARRQFLEACGEALTLIGLTNRFANAQDTVIRRSTVRFELVKEIKGAFLWDVSPDGSMVALCCTAKAASTLRLRPDRSEMANRNAGLQNTLAAMEAGSWNDIYSAVLPGEPQPFRFFLEGKRLCGRITRGNSSYSTIVVDLVTGHIEKATDSDFSGPFIIDVAPLQGNVLLARQALDTMAKLEWPTLREIAKVVGGKSFLPTLTDDRTRGVHIVDNAIVCRRMADLAPVWMRKIDPGILDPGHTLTECAISGDGSIVALAVKRTSYGWPDVKPELFYVELLRGDDGMPLRRIRKDAIDGLLLSPDGKLLGIGEIVPGQTFEAVLQIFDVATGTQITSVVHERFQSKRRLGSNLNWSRFSSDGKYLITSNERLTRFWRISGT